MRCGGSKHHNNGVMAPLQAAARRGRGEAVGGRHREATASTRGTVAPAAMVVAAAPPGVGGGPREDSGLREFLGLVKSTHSARLVPNSQGVASPTNEENRGGRTDPPPTETKTGRGRTGLGGYILVPLPTNRVDWPGDPRGWG